MDETSKKKGFDMKTMQEKLSPRGMKQDELIKCE